MDKKRRQFWKRFDYILFFASVFLSIYGFIIISSATASKKFGSMPFLKQQITAFILGLILIGIILFLDYDFFGKLYIPIYVICNLLLLAVLIFGYGREQWGARSWLSILGFSFQPSEIVKVGMILSIAKFIDKNQESINELKTLLKVIIFASIPITLIAIQPDFGTAMVFVFFTAIMLFVAGLNYKYILFSLIAGFASLPVLWFSWDKYQKKRILGFITYLTNPSADTSGDLYQLDQAITAIGSGKIFGRGLFNGVQTQYNYLPVKESDFIFSVIVEELGLLGGLLLILLYITLLIRLISIAKNTSDLFGSLIPIGVASMMLFHIFQNIGMNMGLLPITGVPLPFVSYGGTFLLVNMICIGLSLSVGVKKEGLNF
ncbi:rod shape-determining protein RodA [Dethiothermospora halolimnae]|uniref:rod shape-determining protein RodA n=1 Tax=Dethiothermospora halolimnae TaxID=3114390 RepID=UPI003CCBE31E